MISVSINAPKNGALKVQRRTFIRTISSPSAPQKLTTFTGVSITRNGKVVTATQSALAPYLLKGDEILVSAGSGSFTGRANLKSVSGNNFTWELDKVDDGKPDTDTVTIMAVFLFQKALWIGNSAARTANVGTVWLGDKTTDDSQPYPIQSGEIHDISPPVGTVEGLQDYVLDVANANDGVTVFWV